jgi:hypothetical protein
MVRLTRKYQIRRKNLSETNTLAYFAPPSVTKKTSFKAQAPVWRRFDAVEQLLQEQLRPESYLTLKKFHGKIQWRYVFRSLTLCRMTFFNDTKLIQNFTSMEEDQL